MIEKTLLAIWGAWLLMILAAAFRVFGFPLARRIQDRRWRRLSGAPRRVALILPVKGFDLQATPRFFDSIFDQDYADYRVIVCFESWQDPVARWLCEHLDLAPDRRVWNHPDPRSGLRSVTLACGGLAQSEGQKVHNQRAAFEDLNEADAIVAFADADILCGKDWLARLVAPINTGTHELSTTYRWLVPKRPTLPNQFACVINASITTQGGAEWSTVLWGGSMALARGVFDELEVPALFKGSLNDDLRLSKAARATGRRIAFVRSLILPTPVDFTWRSFFEFARRQYTQVKFFSPILYTGVNFVLAFYVLGAASIVAALVYGYFFAWIPVAAAYVIDQFRSLGRQQIYLALFPDKGIRQKLFAASWLEHMLTPLWMCLHWLILASTWTQSRLTWAGVTYRIVSKSKTRVLGRRGTAAPLPAGAPGLAMIGSLHGSPRPATSWVRTLAPESAARESVASFSTASSSAERRAQIREELLAATGPTLPAPEESAPAIAASLDSDAAAANPADSVASDPLTAIPIDLSDSAVLPLTTVFHDRLSRGRVARSADHLRTERSSPAAEVLLRKTRVMPRNWPLAEISSAPAGAEGAPADFDGTGKCPFPSARLPLSRLDRIRDKTRLARVPSLEGKIEIRESKPRRPLPPLPLGSILVLGPALHPSTAPPAAPSPKSPKSPKSSVTPAGRLAEPTPPADAALRSLLGPSLAARRPSRPLSSRHESVARALPARSARAHASSSATAPRSARPRGRGPSTRP